MISGKTMRRSKLKIKIVVIINSLILIMLLTACNNKEKASSTNQPLETSQSLKSTIAPVIEDDTSVSETLSSKQIRITTKEGNSILFQLNATRAAESFYNQLPLSVWVDNYSNNEKIFFPPKKLDISNTPLAEGPAVSLAYYEPWGDIAIYYGTCDGASGLYALGKALSGIEYISQMAGEIYIDVANNYSR